MEQQGYADGSNAARDAFRFSCEIIRKSVSALTVGKALGLEPGRDGRCRCPFHNGHDRNMKLYDRDRGFYCFVCHKGGDCIALAKQLIGNNCTYGDAARWIDETFRLGAFQAYRRPYERVRRANARAFRKGQPHEA